MYSPSPSPLPPPSPPDSSGSSQCTRPEHLSQCIKVLNVRPETIKLLEENIGKTLSDINHSQILYDPPARILINFHFHMRVPWTAWSMNQSILKEIHLKYSLEGLMMKLKLKHFGHLMWRSDSLEKTLMLGKIEGRGRRGWQGQDGWMASLTQWTWVWASSRRWWKTGKPGMLQYMGSQRVRHNWMNEQQTNGLLFNHKRNEVLIHTTVQMNLEDCLVK